MSLAQEKGASTWLTALPIEEHSFTLHKGAYRDVLALRYGWQPNAIPSHCACGESFSIPHVLSCARGGYPSIRHNKIRDLTAYLLTEVCHCVSTEPTLQPITSEVFNHATAITEDDARLDIAANGFWGGRLEHAFFDVRVFNPHVPSNHRHDHSASYSYHKNIKKRAYEQRIQDVEHGSFTSLIFSVTTGLGRIATTTYMRLASMLSSKHDQPYSTTMAWLRCRLFFSLLRSSIQEIRGARSSLCRFSTTSSLPIVLVTVESQVSMAN